MDLEDAVFSIATNGETGIAAMSVRGKYRAGIHV